MTERVVVVGASVAATAFIERLREVDDDAEVIVVDPDPDAPYDRPPLSKHYLRGGDAEDIRVNWDDLDVTLMPARATGVDAATKTLKIETSAGGFAELGYDRLVIATGAHPARLPFEPPDTVVLRSAEDARRLRTAVEQVEHLIVIGAGAIGVELASSLVERAGRVTLIDRAAAPLERLLGGHLGAELTRWLEDAGITCVWNAQIASITHDDDGWAVDVGGAEPVRGDVVVSAVGSRPATQWLSASALLTDGALLVDDIGRVLAPDGPVQDVFAIGDAASRRDLDGRLTRTESWEAARHQGVRVANHLAEATTDDEGLTYFWTEVAGRNVQVVGQLHPKASLELEFENPQRRAALYRARHGEEVAWIGINAQPLIAKIRMGL